MSPVDQTGTTFKFPLTVYDRPSIAIANLLKGNIDASTRAIFSPMTLSPNEMKNIRQKFMKGDSKDDPIIKTAVDLATNPIIIIGLIMALGSRGQIGSPAELSALWSAGGKMLKEASPLIRGLMSPFTAMRSTWHLNIGNGMNPLDAMIEVARRTRNFKRIGAASLARSEKMFLGASGQSLTRTQKMLSYHYLSGMHHLPKLGKKREILQAPLQAYYIEHFGKTASMMPNLKEIIRKESPHLMAHIKRLQQDYSRYGKITLTDATGKVHNQMVAKGVEIIFKDYAPRMTTRSSMERFLTGSKAFTAKAYQGVMRRMGEGGGELQDHMLKLDLVTLFL